MKVAIEAVRDAGALCEAAICYTGDILDPKRTKYDLKYYVELAKELEKRRRPPAGHQGHGRPVQALRGREAGQDAHAARSACRSTSTRTTPAACRPPACSRRRKPASTSSTWPLASHVGPDLAAEPELGRRVAPLHAPRHPARFRRLAIELDQYWEAVRAVLRAVRNRHDGQHRRRLSQRNARRPVHQPVRAGQGPRPGPPLARNLQDVRRSATSCSATSSKSRRRRRSSATWPCSWSPTT